MAALSATALMAMNPEARRVKSSYDGLSKAEIMQRMAL
jgi:hypothetical protein